MLRFLCIACFPFFLQAQTRDTLAAFRPDSTFFVRTKGALAYLNYGVGEDRLGGAKMGYVDSLVLLKVTAKYKDLYRVRLTGQLSAWIPQTLTKRDTNVRLPSVQYLTASWRVSGDNRQDYVSIPLPERLPYRSRQEINPARIVVDIFGVTANTNWITQLRTAREIKNIDYEQVADEQFRVIISLRHAQHWGYAIGYEGRRLVIRVMHQPEKLRLRDLTIAIDAGHGGSNLGARGLRSKQYEKDFNLSIARHLQKELERKGATVLMTRSNDSLINNTDRVLSLRKLKPDLLISIHNNAAGDTTKTKGTSTYYKHLGYRPLSQAILERLLETGLTEYGNVGRFNFALNSPTEYPNVLVEGLFLSHPDDEALILEDAYRKKMAKQIRKGVADWLKQVRKQRS
ncbi:N-acetylmuramoyl-L-alanine amidase [Runella sp. CRIBMP]|uniref:N-acetylmuramoyl-L-alanine amidase family protein n=1 Tax=Runella sp. CRIBMP TaxID=2683261 RepID=UPI001411CCBD|nr:N-acetylmuramoyl-L-alanine amidase [Runella sp. CRIBMP]NBB20159.1 N-acetylmuramoyl-L-alanine amidase [Runella sp. CRIBMP]